MFAIELTHDTLPEILKLDFLTLVDRSEIGVYVRSPKTWYFVRGYVNHRGQLEPWAVFPENILQRSYEYDPIKIKNQWDQIVRK